MVFMPIGGAAPTGRGVPSATGMPLLMKTFSCNNTPEVGGAVPLTKSSLIALRLCAPFVEAKKAVKVLLKPKVEFDGISPNPLVLASTATVGLGLPGNNQTGCVPHDTDP